MHSGHDPSPGFRVERYARLHFMCFRSAVHRRLHSTKGPGSCPGGIIQTQMTSLGIGKVAARQRNNTSAECTDACRMVGTSTSEAAEVIPEPLCARTEFAAENRWSTTTDHCPRLSVSCRGHVEWSLLRLACGVAVSLVCATRGFELQRAPLQIQRRGRPFATILRCPSSPNPCHPPPTPATSPPPPFVLVWPPHSSPGRHPSLVATFPRRPSAIHSLGGGGSPHHRPKRRCTV